MATYKVLYGRRFQSLIFWEEGGQTTTIGPELVQITNAAVQNLAGFVIPYLEGISRFKKKGKMINKRSEICRKILDFSRKIIIKYSESGKLPKYP